MCAAKRRFEQCVPLLRKIRSKLGLDGSALIIPSDVHDYLVDHKWLFQHNVQDHSSNFFDFNEKNLPSLRGWTAMFLRFTKDTGSSLKVRRGKAELYVVIKCVMYDVKQIIRITARFAIPLRPCSDGSMFVRTFVPPTVIFLVVEYVTYTTSNQTKT